MSDLWLLHLSTGEWVHICLLKALVVFVLVIHKVEHIEVLETLGSFPGKEFSKFIFLFLWSISMMSMTLGGNISSDFVNCVPSSSRFAFVFDIKEASGGWYGILVV